MTKDLFSDGGGPYRGPTPNPLEQARLQVRRDREGGTHCPCCGLYVREYRRALNSTMARGLIRLVRTFALTNDWVYTHKGGSLPRDWVGDFAKLKYWNLMEPLPNEDDETKRATGVWRPTRLGVDFVMLRVKVPSHVVIFNDTIQGFSGDDITIIEALGKKFNYGELMRGDG